MDGEANPERRPTERLADPKKPSEAEVRQHEITCLPYRSSCWACMHGRGKNKPHRTQRNERGLQDIHFDFVPWGPRGSRRDDVVHRGLGSWDADDARDDASEHIWGQLRR